MDDRFRIVDDFERSNGANGAVTLVGAGPVSAQMLSAARRIAPAVVAADGGADRALALGVTPELIIGDLDSLQNVEAWEAREDVGVLRVAEQDSTDLEKCLTRVPASLTIGVGFLGGRLDHSLAAMHALVAHAAPLILLGEEDLAFAPPPRWRARLEIGARVSIFPMRPCRAVRSEGLKWPLDGLMLEAGRQIGTSNETISDEVLIDIPKRGAVVITETRFLNQVAAGLRR